MKNAGLADGWARASKSGLVHSRRGDFGILHDPTIASRHHFSLKCFGRDI